MLRVAISLFLFSCLILFFTGWAKIGFDTRWFSSSFEDWPWWAILIAVSPVLTGLLSSLIMAFTRDGSNPTLQK